MKVWIVSEGEYEDSAPVYAFNSKELADEFVRLADEVQASKSVGPVSELEVLGSLPEHKYSYHGWWREKTELENKLGFRDRNVFKRFYHGDELKKFPAEERCNIEKHPVKETVEYLAHRSFNDYARAVKAAPIIGYRFDVSVTAFTQERAQELLESAIAECQTRRETGEQYEDA